MARIIKDSKNNLIVPPGIVSHYGGIDNNGDMVIYLGKGLDAVGLGSHYRVGVQQSGVMVKARVYAYGIAETKRAARLSVIKMPSRSDVHWLVEVLQYLADILHGGVTNTTLDLRGLHPTSGLSGPPNETMPGSLVFTVVGTTESRSVNIHLY